MLARHAKKLWLDYAFGGTIIVIVVLLLWPYRIGTPNARIRVMDEAGRPLAGLRVTRDWRTSERYQGKDEAVTDANGIVTFEQRIFSISMLKRVTKPLLIFVPASCGPGYQVSTDTEFCIYWPESYSIHVDKREWVKKESTWENKDGIRIVDPALPTQRGDATQRGDSSVLVLSFFNRKRDFDHTLVITRLEEK